MRDRKRPILWVSIGACILLLLVFLTTLGSSAPLLAQTRYLSKNEYYLYDDKTEVFPAPAPYRHVREVSAADLGVDSLAGMTSLFVTKDKLYIAQGDSIIITDKDFEVIEQLSEFENNGEKDRISGPGGLFVDQHENLYVTDPGGGRILLFDRHHELIREMGKPEAVGLENVTYSPTKLVVDRVGRMFVVSRNIYEGIMELTPNGNFTRYYGVNTVRFNPLELFWRSIATDAQRERMRLWLPTDFTNLDITEDGFIYAVVNTPGGEPIKLFNAKGADILRYPQGLRPRGDYTRGLYQTSTFASIDQNELESYMVLDTTRGRIFTYNRDGYLLYEFGGLGSRDGFFQTPVDARFDGDRILVLDQMAQSIEVFEPTQYGLMINQAVEADVTNRPDDAAKYWTEVARLNPYFQLAYISMGDAAYRQDDYQAAQDYYRQGGFRRGYSDAMKQTRSQWLDENISYILLGLLALIVFLTWWLVIKPQMQRRHREVTEGDLR